MRESGFGGRCSKERRASQKTHPASAVLLVTYSSRQGDHRRSIEVQSPKFKVRRKCSLPTYFKLPASNFKLLLDGLHGAGDAAGNRRRFGRFSLAVDQLLQLLARLEVRDFL